MRWSIRVLCVLVATFCGPAVAKTLPAPEGAVILTVTGAIAQANSDQGAQFDLAMLQAMETEEFQTTTIWTEGPQVFRGVPLVRLIEVLEAEGQVIAASALNDYAVDIPISDAVPGGPLLAFQMNGVALSPRDKGPIWLVYPYDAGESSGRK